MLKSKNFRDLSASTIQTGITQLATILIFYVMSKYISKIDFGLYNWTMAVGSTLIAIGSLGLDLVLVKRIAAGENSIALAGIHFFHAALVSILLILGLPILLLFQDQGQYASAMLPALIIFQLSVNNITNSFKFSLQGLEQFAQLARVSIVLNCSKLLIIFSLLLTNSLSLTNIVIGFVLASILELVFGYIFVSKSLGYKLKPLFRKKEYSSFIIESLPQLGVVIFDSALARIDWILLGVISTATVIAEYSFAYRFFELSKLPLLILAPILLTRFAKLFAKVDQVPDKSTLDAIHKLLKFELFLAYLIPVFIVCVWPDLIDLITDNKYGKVNHLTYSILSICIPIHFLTNFFWTLGFVQNELKKIMYVTIFSSALNILINLVLIPHFQSQGAALAFLFSSLAQLIAYILVISQDRFRVKISSIISFGLIAIVAIAAARLLFSNAYLQGVVAALFYIGLSISFRQVPKLSFLNKA